MGRNTALILIAAICILGPALIFSAASYASILALGRNPSSAPKIFTAMIIALVFGQALAIIVMLIVFQLFNA